MTVQSDQQSDGLASGRRGADPKKTGDEEAKARRETHPGVEGGTVMLHCAMTGGGDGIEKWVDMQG